MATLVGLIVLLYLSTLNPALGTCAGGRHSEMWRMASASTTERILASISSMWFRKCLPAGRIKERVWETMMCL